MKIGIIADIHLPKKERPPRPEPGKKPEPIPDDPTTAKVKAFYEKAKTENYDFVINLGDVVGNSGDADHDYMTASMFSRSMIGSTVNTYHVLGNRDCMSFLKIFFFIATRLSAALTGSNVMTLSSLLSMQTIPATALRTPKVLPTGRIHISPKLSSISSENSSPEPISSRRSFFAISALTFLWTVLSMSTPMS